MDDPRLRPAWASGDSQAPSLPVLVVDDEEDILLVCREHLRKAGFSVRTATSGEQALAILAEGPTAAILTDYSMPGMSGVELLSLVRERYPAIERVLFTGVGDLRIPEEGIARGALFRFLVKPFAAETLVSCVRAAVDAYCAAQEARRRTDEVAALMQSQAASLAEAHAFLEGLLFSFPAGVLAVEADGVVSQANPAACEILGRPVDALLGHRAAEVGAPEGDFLLSHEESNYVTPGGERRTLLWSRGCFSVGPGTSGRSVLCFLDVSRRVELERRVFRAKREIEAVFDSITDPIYVLDRHKNVTRANRAFAQFVGRAFPEIVGEPCPKLLSGYAHDCSACPLDGFFQKGAGRQWEWRDPNGHIYKTYIFPIFEAREVTGAVLRVQDVTGERELEQRLLQSEKMASIGQLAAGVAHEINNPVGFILSGLNRLAEYAATTADLRKETRALAEAEAQGQVDPHEAWERYRAALARSDFDFLVGDVAAVVEECKEGTGRIRKIVQDLKTFSHPDGADSQYTDLNQALESTLNIVWNELKYKCEVVRQYGKLPPVLCRPSQVNQVFMNLLVNAAQSIPDRGVVTLTSWFDAETDHAFVRVADTGVGIPLDLQRKVFDPFFTTKPVGAGTGLGLHLALGIVRRHGGEIRLESEPGRGSAFTVVLPVNRGAPADGGAPS